MKKILLTLICSGAIQCLMAQVGFNNPNPHSSSILDIKSIDKGLLIPRLNSAQRTNVVNPAHGLLVFDAEQAVFYFYDSVAAGVPGGKGWMALNSWKIQENTGDSILFTLTAGNVGIGTNTPQAKLDVMGSGRYADTLKVMGPVRIGTGPATQKLDVDGNALISGNLTAQNLQAATANITGSVTAGKLTGDGAVPPGGIIMWSGTVATIPAGWALCDGNNGTPNLRGRFIVGYDEFDTDYNQPGKRGPVYSDADGFSDGSNSFDAKQIKLTGNQSGMPSHGHTINDPGHSHSFDVLTSINGKKTLLDPNEVGLPIDPINKVRNTKQSFTNVSINPSAQMNANEAHENRPPFYVLAYIMKLP